MTKVSYNFIMTKNTKIVKKEGEGMPKIYSDEEKKEIKRKLHKEANDCLQHYGVKKTTVDELVARVGIPKGTFYLFYKSKELLLFEVIQEYHEKIEQNMIQQCEQLGTSLNVDSLTQIIAEGILSVQNSCLKTLMVPEEMETLIRKLPEEVKAEHLEEDDDLMLEMLGKLPLRNAKIDYKAFSGAFRAIFFSCMYQDEIGKENFYASISLMIKGLLLQLIRSGEENESNK